MGPFPSSTLSSSSLCIFLFFTRPPSRLFGYFRFSTKSPPLYTLTISSIHYYTYYMFPLCSSFHQHFSLLLSFYRPTPTPSIPPLLKPLRQLLFQPPNRAVAIRFSLHTHSHNVFCPVEDLVLIIHTQNRKCAIRSKFVLRNVPIYSNMMTGSVKWTNTGWWPWLTCLSTHSQRIFIRRM